MNERGVQEFFSRPEERLSASADRCPPSLPGQAVSHEESRSVFLPSVSSWCSGTVPE